MGLSRRSGARAMSLRYSHPDRDFVTLILETPVSWDSAPPRIYSKSDPAERNRSGLRLLLRPGNVRGAFGSSLSRSQTALRRLGSIGESAVGAGLRLPGASPSQTAPCGTDLASPDRTTNRSGRLDPHWTLALSSSRLGRKSPDWLLASRLSASLMAVLWTRLWHLDSDAGQDRSSAWIFLGKTPQSRGLPGY